MKNPVLLLDADVLCHRVAYSCTKKFKWDDGPEALHLDAESVGPKIQGHIDELVSKLHARDVVICLSARDGNFRKDIAPYYKGTRRPKPELWETARQYLELGQIDYRVVVYSQLEGDDVLGILHTGAYRDTSVIVTIDKDMRTVPGRTYFTHKERGIEEISPRAAAQFHLSQVITGDSTDEYPGLPGAGPARWVKIAAAWDGKSIMGLWGLVVAAFAAKGLPESEAITQARLAFILHDGFYHHKSAKVVEWTPEYYKNL